MTDATSGLAVITFSAATSDAALFRNPETPDGAKPVSFPYAHVAAALLRHTKKATGRISPFLQTDFSQAAYILMAASDHHRSALDNAGARARWESASKGYWGGDHECLASSEEVRRGFAETFDVSGILFRGNAYPDLGLMFSAIRTGFSLIRESEDTRDFTGTALLLLAALNYQRISKTRSPEAAAEVLDAMRREAEGSGLPAGLRENLLRAVLAASADIFETVTKDARVAAYFGLTG